VATRSHSAGASEDVDPDLELLQRTLGLRTGEDAIEFFGRHQAEPQFRDIKVLFFNRPPPSLNFRPYDLTVCHRTETCAEYFTMSSSGVVHVRPNTSSQFIPLGTWWRHSSMFNAIRTIPFFKNYLNAKTYQLWSSNVRYRKYSQIRKQLTKQLFLGKKAFCPAIMELGALCYELQKTPFITCNSKHVYGIEEFEHAQSAQRATAAKTFDSIIDQTQDLLKKVCEEVTSRVRPSQDLTGLDEDGTTVTTKRGEKSKSMLAMKLEAQARKRALDVAKQEVAMLPHLIRLTDHMVVESLLEMLISSCAAFLEQMENPPKKTGMFLTTVSIGRETQSIDFSPTKHEVSTMISTMTESMITAINSVMRILYLVPLKPYFKDRSPNGPHLGDMIRRSEVFSKIRASIEKVITTDFNKCREYGEIFEDYRPIFLYGESFDQDAFANQDHIANSRVIKKEMTKLRTWGQELDRMKLNAIIGIFHVDSKTLRNSLVTIKDRCLEQMKGVLHDVARLSCLQVLQEFHNHIRNLQRKPTTLKEFAQYVEQKNKIKDDEKNIIAAAGTVDDMYRLLGQFEVKIPPPEQVKLDDLHSINSTFFETLQQAEGDVTARMPSMSMALDKNINALDEELLTILATLGGGDSMNERNDPKNTLAWLAEVKESIAAISEKADQYTKYQVMFKLVPYEYTNMRAAEEQWEARNSLWKALDDWEDLVLSWQRSEWSSLVPEDMAKEIQEALKNATRIHKAREEDRVALRFRKSVEVWKGYSACLVDLGNTALKQRHWDQIFSKLSMPTQHNFTLENLIEWHIFSIRDAVSEISGVASGEAALETQLATIQEAWADMNFTLSNYRESNVYVLSAVDDIFVQLEDHQAALQTMLASRFVLGIRSSVEEWDKKLAVLSETLDEWLTCQRNWMYLEAIFGAPDIQKQLPNETVKFLRVDQNWKDHMRRTHKRLNILEVSCHEGVLQLFQESNRVLEEIQKSLEDYLETKRAAFPRFYFLSNDELLEILSQTRDPRAVRPHLRKCFDSMAEVEFSGEVSKEQHQDDVPSVWMVNMQSAEGEVVQFTDKVPCSGNVEFWMLSLESMMRRTLHNNCAASVAAYSEEGRTDWLFAWPAQTVLTVDQIVWTSNVTTALLEINSNENEHALQEFKDKSILEIEAMVEVVRGALTPIQRGCMCNLIVVDVHARDVVERMIGEGCSNVTDFAWICQLRYYWESATEGAELECFVKQTNASFHYGNEYLGVQPRLVITPLTDKCFMTLTGALNLILGGAPAGPAGTGKTESVKDLGKALAHPVVVFNCSDGLDYKMMGRFFSGLAQAGAWACFDEFNRIDIEVLSVIAQQILTIQQALKQGVDRFEFEGREMALNTGYGCFITMNPGYAGRTELPDNLKALFRPMAMMVPDYALIAEIMLFSEGFKGAKNLARKMTSMYRLASEQLSQQDHYDFGMRAVKSVLVMAGTLKRSNPDMDEELTLIRALRDSNVPKFLADDIPLFIAIVRDLFPGVTLPTTDYAVLEASICARLLEEKLQVVPSFTPKIIQLYETLTVRHGAMLVGVTATGKTTVSKTLGDALTSIHKEGLHPDVEGYDVVNRFVINPKAITMGELYGEFNLQTNEWTDGVIASIVRQGLTATDTNQKWVICDGPVDAIWIESMNTVLDDNKTLCLNNGERIKLPKTMRMLFEVNDLAVASPATVSRCGMVYLEQVYLGWRPIAASWIQHTLTPRYPNIPMGERMNALLEDFVDPTLSFIRKECRENMESVDTNLVMSLCNLLDVLLTEANGVTAENGILVLPLVFVFSYMWTLGGNLHDSSVSGMDRFARKLCRTKDIELPDAGLLYDYCVDAAKGLWVPWEKVVPEFRYRADASFFNLIVPTVDTTRTSFVLSKVVEGGYNVLLGGNSGVGKTVIAQEFLADAPERFTSATKLFSAQTSAANLQAFLEEKLEKLRKNLLGPPSGKTIIFFIDDLNMPQKETYGAQPPIELLRQIINVKDDKCGGFYDRQKVGLFKKVAHTQFICACAPPGGGRQEVTPRFLRHFHMLNVPDLSESSMRSIFGYIVAGFLSKMRPEMQQLGPHIVDASIAVYSRIVVELLPTPSHSHYTFNLRDLAKVIQGILMVEEADLPDAATLIRLWCHESARVFSDRLIDNSDKTWFTTLQKEVLATHFSVTWDEEMFVHTIFGDFMETGPASYQEITDLQRCTKVLQDYAEDYSLTYNKPMDLVFFRDAIEHVSRLCRVLRQPRGNLCLVGVGGSGRQSLARLASHAAEYKLFQIELTRVYGVNEFHEDLKKVLMTAGASNLPCVFLINDTQFVRESFLEDINNVLNAGEVPDLFARDEMEKIVDTVRPLAKAAGKLLTRDVIYSHFVQLVRENLHIIIAMSPVGETFRARLRQFPSLVNCCTIDWFTEWPDDALISVASKLFVDTDLGNDELRSNICRMCNVIHSSVSRISGQFLTELRRHNYTTPMSYLELINLYLSMLSQQRGVNESKVLRYQGGVQKLVDTNEMVGSLKIDLQKLAPVLVTASEETNVLLEEVTRDSAAAQEAALLVEAEAAQVNQAAEEAQEIKNSAQKDLDEAMPAFHAAMSALRSLNKNDITEIKSFAKPPKLVETVMEAVCLLKGVKPDWDEAKKLLTQSNFLQSLEEYDKDNIPDKTIRALAKYIKNPDFQPDTVEKVSKAAKSLCLWVRAMDKYSRVSKTVEPKRQRLKAAEKKRAEMTRILSAKQAELAEQQARVQALQDKLTATMNKRDELQSQSDETVARLQRAEELISGLGGEKVRWQAELQQLDKDRHNLVGNSLVAAAVLSYSGPFTAGYRDRLVETWVTKSTALAIPVDPHFSLERIVSDPVEVREWALQGLPSDKLSVENGIIMTRGRRWPLLIDPQTQANRWIRAKEKENTLTVIKLTEQTYLRTLENCIRVGNPVLLENVEEALDPALEPVLQKQTFKQSGRLMIRLGDTDIDYSPQFSLYITTKLPNPHYPPEICVKVTVVNFTVTPKGLEDQLLTLVIGFERPELEEMKGKLVVEIAEGQKKLKEIEDKILHMLAESTGNILDDHVLIATLGQSKSTSQQINEQLEKAESTKLKIDDACEGYRPVATRGSILYFVIADMGDVDPMYQYSLQYFLRLFKGCLERSPKSSELPVRVATLLQVCTADIYSNICRGLFERNKRMFAFLIAVQIMRQDERITEAEWHFFLTRGGMIDDAKLPPNPAPQWLKKEVWGALQLLQEISDFNGLRISFMNATDEWYSWVSADDPYAAPLPSPWDGRCSNFGKLLLIRALREERTVAASTEFILDELGSHFVESPPFDLTSAFNESSTVTPIIFALSPGADPIGYLLKLAEDLGVFGRLKLISLGQGQGPIAQKLIEVAREAGEWVCLQNCHLAASWMPELEKLLEAQSTMKLHEDFRLWLTSMPSAAFPVSVLQSGIKLTNEPPKGLRANIKRTYDDMTEKFHESCSKPQAFKKLLFAVAFFHAVVQERRKFGAIGWNIPYEWNQSDLQTAQANLRMYLDEQEQIPYETLSYVIGEVNYGGRITDTWDQRCARSLLSQYFCPKLMEDSYKFTLDGVYYAPPDGPLADHRTYVDSLPLVDAPEVFGLHNNASITFEAKETRELMNTIIAIQPRTGAASGGKTSDEIVGQLAVDIQSKMPPALSADRETADPQTFQVDETTGALNSMGTYLLIEIGKFNKLLNRVNSSLREVQRAIKGQVVMSADLEAMYGSFLLGTVPSMWTSVSYLSAKPLGGWIKDLVARVNFLDHWIKTGPPIAFWISAFFFPQGFMTAALQLHARSTQIPIDTLDFRTELRGEMQEDLTAAPEAGVFVYGLFMEGARWDGDVGLLAESNPGELFTPVPVVWLEPIESSELEVISSQSGGYQCPLYKVSTRAGTLSTTGHSTNFVRALEIPSKLPSEHWVRRGVAMLSQLDD